MLAWNNIASFPGPAQLSIAISTASDRKLNGAWERGQNNGLKEITFGWSHSQAEEVGHKKSNLGAG